jgi:two-component system LytT family response regulator
MLLGDPEVELVRGSICSNQPELSLEELQPDVVLLDMDFMGRDLIPGLSLSEPVDRPVVIALASDEARAVTAYRIHALDFLVKPVGERRLRDAMRWAKAEARLRRTRVSEGNGAEDRPAAERPGRVLVKSRGRVILLRVEEIDWVEAQGGYVRIHTGAGKYLLREKISAMEERLPPDRFVRIHRSAIVNLDSVKELLPHRYGSCTVILEDGTRLVMSRTFRDGVMHRFTDSAALQVH